MVNYKADSIYQNTPIIDNKYLDIQVPVIVNHDEYLLKEIEIDARYNHRPDLLANALYGRPDVWWLFAEFNQDTLRDPIMDFTTGTIINVPESF